MGGPPWALHPPAPQGVQTLGTRDSAEGCSGPTKHPSTPSHCPWLGQARTSPPSLRQTPGVPLQYLGRAHCCLQVESLRILLLAEQALREGLEEALARRSPLALVLSCPGSVPFMHTALGSPLPRLCPFCPASSSGTCPARERPQ